MVFFVSEVKISGKSKDWKQDTREETIDKRKSEEVSAVFSVICGRFKMFVVYCLGVVRLVGRVKTRDKRGNLEIGRP